MKITRSLFLILLLASFALLASSSPVSGLQRRGEGRTRWLFPRKGGGHAGGDGGGGEGGGGGGGSGGGGGESGGDESGDEGSSSSGSSGTKAPPPDSDENNDGGSTISGSGTLRGSDGFYSGGATVPYRSGYNSPLGLRPYYISPYAHWWPFYWGPWGYYYYRLNETAPALANNTAHNTTDPILCVCEDYQECGCDNANSSYQLPSDLMYAVVNGTEYAIINGTLDNGTTAPGGNISATSGVVGTTGYLLNSWKWASWIVFGVVTFLLLEIV